MFSREMQYKSLQLIKCFLARYAKNENPDNIEADFETVARQRMKEEINDTTAVAASFSLALQQSKQIKESHIDEMISMIDKMGACTLFDKRPVGFFNEIKHRRMCKVLSSMLRKSRVSDTLRAKCVRLMFKAGLAYAQPSTLLKAANFAFFYKVDLSRDMEFVCK